MLAYSSNVDALFTARCTRAAPSITMLGGSFSLLRESMLSRPDVFEKHNFPYSDNDGGKADFHV